MKSLGMSLTCLLWFRLGIGRVGIGLDGHESPYLRGGIDNDAVIAINNSESALYFSWPNLVQIFRWPPTPYALLMCCPVGADDVVGLLCVLPHD